MYHSRANIHQPRRSPSTPTLTGRDSCPSSKTARSTPSRTHTKYAPKKVRPHLFSLTDPFDKPLSQVIFEAFVDIICSLYCMYLLFLPRRLGVWNSVPSCPNGKQPRSPASDHRKGAVCGTCGQGRGIASSWYVFIISALYPSQVFPNSQWKHVVVSPLTN